MTDTTKTLAGRVPEDVTAVLIIAAIIVVCGLVGGYAAFMSEEKADPDGADVIPSALRFLLLGIVAAACVPLFLSLVRSEVVTVILTNRSGQRLESYLVFIGLCLIAAFSSRRFIESVSQRILQQVEKAGAKAERAERKADAAQETALEIADERSAEVQAPRTSIESMPTELVSIPGLGEHEARALLALRKMSYRTATGVAADVGMPRGQISEVLDGLAAKGFAAVTQSPTTKGLRWKITAQGIEEINAARDSR